MLRYIFVKTQAYVFQEEMGRCVAFLINNDEGNNSTVLFQHMSFELLPKSISILSDCERVIFNTAKVSSNVTFFDLYNMSNS